MQVSKAKLTCFPLLKLASLEQLDVSFCNSLENFPPVDSLETFSPVVDKLLDKFKFLRIRYCPKLKSIPSLKLALLEQRNLLYCETLKSFTPVVDGGLEKLQIFKVISCRNIKSIRPLMLTLLEELEISHFNNLKKKFTYSQWVAW